MTNNRDYKEFSTKEGLTERYYAMTSDWQDDFKTEAEQLLKRYREQTPDPASQIMIRFHLSDIANQIGILNEIVQEEDAFISIVGQAPVNGSRIALEAWHNDGVRKKMRYVDDERKALYVTMRHYSYLISGSSSLSTDGGYDQTLEEYVNLDGMLFSIGGSMERNVQKTWLFCRDIDHNYDDYIRAKRPCFEARGLTHLTHYVSSAGAEGKLETAARMIKLEAFSLFGHDRAQIQYMKALNDMYPPKFFGITYERGTRIIYGDRSQYYLGGTVSIDGEGNILHPGNAGAQTERVIHNLRAILENHEAVLGDLQSIIVYIRDPADAGVVEQTIEDSDMGSIPRLMIHAPVTDPTWLVGIDATAVNNKGNSRFAPFC